MAYAENTTVSSEKSRNEIERTLMRYGADQFAYMSGRDGAAVAFVANGKQVRFTITLPNRSERRFTHTPTGQVRADSTALAEYEKAVRQKWRALALVVKAKLEAVDAGIVTFEQEFFAHLVLPGGQSVYEHVSPAVEQAYLGNTRPMLAITAGGVHD